MKIAEMSKLDRELYGRDLKGEFDWSLVSLCCMWMHEEDGACIIGEFE